MTLYSNKAIVLRLIQKASMEHPDWELGKKALQKSLYFFNLEHSCFRFQWANFGPMSGEIQQIAHDLKAVGRIKISSVETGKPDAFLHRIKYIPKTPALEVPPNIDEALDATMKFVARRDSRELELLASVHFWAIRNNDRYAVEDIHLLLEVLKPDAGFSKTDVEHAIHELKKNKLLT